MSEDRKRYIVWMPGQPSWELPPASHTEQKGGGHLVLHELAVAIAATGRAVEVRGEFDFGELARLGEAAGKSPDLPSEPRAPRAGDVVVMPEGVHDPFTFGSIALSRVRAILLLLGPPGLVGWPFTDGWSLEHAVDVEVESVARPEHFRAMAAMGFELWSIAPALTQRSKAAGIPATYIGEGRPVPYPAPSPKRYDVVTLAYNRWSSLAAEVVSRLDPSVLHYRIPQVSNHEMLRRFGEARILIHPLRVEGTSRIGHEARAMGAVPVVLNSSPFTVGLDEESGAVPVGTLDEMPEAVMRLLGDPARLEELRERGMRSVRAAFDWDRFVERVDAALSVPPKDDAWHQARAGIGEALRKREEQLLAPLRAEITALWEVKAALEVERDALVSALDEAKETIRAIQDTRVWRLAGAFWRMRRRVRRLGRSC